MRWKTLVPLALLAIACPHTQTASDRVRWTSIAPPDLKGEAARDGVLTVDQTTRVGIRIGDKFCLEPVGPVVGLQDFSLGGRLAGSMNTGTDVNVAANFATQT